MAQMMKYELLFEEYEALIALYESIDNIREMRTNSHVLDNCCLINAKMIWDINQILCAINKAIYSGLNAKLITKRLNNEILFNLYPGKYIKEGLKTFGANENNDSLPVIVLVVNKLNSDLNTNNSNYFDKIKGKLLPIESLKTLRNEPLIEKTYNLQNCTTDEKAKWDLIISKIATKDLI